MNATAIKTLVLGACMMLACATAEAGRSCEQKHPTVNGVQRSLALAQETAARLDQTGAHVVAIARVGQDLSPYRLHYSHMGFAYRDGKTWRVVHKLNQCGAARADLYRQGLGEFFMDDPFDYEAGFVVLTPEVQARLLPALRDNTRVARLNTTAYNMVAYPWSVMYQQSNQWALETLAMTQEPAAITRERAQAWLKLHGYEPTTLKISAFKRLGARMTAANIAFDDHPNAKRFTDRIETVTVDSVFAWLNNSGLGGAVQAVR